MTQRKRGRGRPVGDAPRRPLNPVEITRAAAMKRFRARYELSQSDLASMLGVSQASVSAYEQARSPIPEEVFEQLVETAREKEGVAQTVEEAQQQALLDSANEAADIPPEILDALRTTAAAAEGDPEAAEKMQDVMGNLRTTMIASLPGDTKASVADVRMAYVMLAKILARFVDPDLGSLVDAQSGDLALSVVQASEVSPFLKRIVDLLKVGPLSSCVMLHIMLLVQYDGIRTERNKQRAAAARAAHDAQPPPAPPAQQRDASPLGAFTAAAA